MRPRPVVLLAAAVTVCAACTLTKKYLVDVSYWISDLVRGEGKIEGDAQEGEWTYRHPNGALAQKGNYVDDKQDGKWSYWYDNGQLEQQGFFLDGYRSGFWQYWNENGTKYAEGYFDEGYEEGHWKYYDGQGRLRCAGEFRRGKQADEWTYYHPNETASARGLFLDGDKVGTWRYWDADGAEAGVEQFSAPSGVVVVQQRRPDGSLERRGTMRDGELVGRWTAWHPNGTRRLGGDFVDGAPAGVWSAESAQGEFLAAGPVEEGDPIGGWSVREGEDGIVLVDASRARDRTSARPIAPDLTGNGAATIDDPIELTRAWLADIRAPMSGVERIVPEPEPVVEVEPPPALEEATEGKPEAPIKAQPFTFREVNEFEDYVDKYASESKVPPRSSGRYGPRKRTENRMREFEGTRLPITRFLNVAGRVLDVSKLNDKPLLLVILRGSVGRGREVCIYCTAQTIALAGAADQLEALANVVIVYPGPAAGLRAFQDAYASLGPEQKEIPFDLVSDLDERLVRALRIESDLADPTTLVLDRQGVIRFTYRGADIEDRPPLGLIVSELEKLR